MHTHDLGIDVCQLRVRDSKLGREVASEIVEHRIAALDQFAENLLTFWVLQIEAKAPLVAIKRLVEVAVARSEELRSNCAPNVPAVMEILDLDDLGAEIGKMLGAKGACSILLD